MRVLLSSQIQDLVAQVNEVARLKVAPYAEAVDKDCLWPKKSLDALKEAGLMGLHVPKFLGGHGQGLLALLAMAESLGKFCSSTAMCYGMHCVGTAVIAAKATSDQNERFLKPIAKGAHITTLALSETGTGVHFYLPQTTLTLSDGQYVIEGEKQFVTNGGHADSYVLSGVADRQKGQTGEFSCVIIGKEAIEQSWQEPWHGLGMRGNASRRVELKGVRVPQANLLGQEGDEIWYTFEIIAPYFLMAMAGTYLGIAQSALDFSVKHIRGRRFHHSGEALSDAPVLQSKVAELWGAVQRTREFVYAAAERGDMGNNEKAIQWIMAAKVEASETAVYVTNEAMTLCGGIAYRENAKLGRLLRDARASHVMAPTTTVLKQWLGRSLLGLPIL
jgi:isovaleryl-CoA dehydrogenase